MPIETLIDSLDADETVADAIADILVAESAAQQALGTAAGRDPREWALRVFIERDNPWEHFVNDQAEQLDRTPIVSIYYGGDTVNLSASNLIEQQKHAASFELHCFGCGVSVGDPTYGTHAPGDLIAAQEAVRAGRLVRSILMSAHYHQLGLPGVVQRRWVSARSEVKRVQDSTAQHVAVRTLTLQVEFNEYAPQHPLRTLERIVVTAKHPDTGEVLLTANIIGDS